MDLDDKIQLGSFDELVTTVAKLGRISILNLWKTGVEKDEFIQDIKKDYKGSFNFVLVVLCMYTNTVPPR